MPGEPSPENLLAITAYGATGRVRQVIDAIELPTYPEYAQLLAEADRIARRPVDPRSIGAKEALIRRRGGDWCAAVLGRPCNGGLGSISCVEAELLVLADAADIDPPLPRWLVDARAETARRKAEQDERRAALRRRDEEAWAAVRAECPVEVEVRQNTTVRVRRGERQYLGHAVPLVDALSGSRRQHPAGRALCETPTRAKPLALGGPVDAPATCDRCLAYVPKIRAVKAPDGIEQAAREADPDATMVAAVLAGSGRPMTTELLVSAANAYAALRSSRERHQATEVRAPRG